MPEAMTEVVQPKPGEAAPAVDAAEKPKADQTQDGGEGGAAPATELPASGEPEGDKATPQDGGEPAADAKTDDAGEPGKDGKPADKGGIDKRFAELTKARREAERQAADTQKRLDQALEALSRMGKEPPKAEPGKPAAEEDQKPEAPEFSNPETFAKEMAQYTERLTMWATRQAVKADRAESEKKRVQDEQQQNTTRIQQEFAARRKKALETFPDYAEVAESPELTITPVMATGITVDAEGTAIAYWLGKNPAEAERISKLPPGMQLMELGAVKARLLAARTEKPKNNLPPPIRPQGNSGGVSKSLDELDMDSYAAKRNADEAAQRSGGRTH